MKNGVLHTLQVLRRPRLDAPGFLQAADDADDADASDAAARPRAGPLRHRPPPAIRIRIEACNLPSQNWTVN